MLIGGKYSIVMNRTDTTFKIDLNKTSSLMPNNRNCNNTLKTLYHYIFTET